MNNKKDAIYSKPQKHLADFVFDNTVADVFDDMIRRSVPGYPAIINMIGVLAKEYVKADTHCYDLGCSLGSASLAMQDNIQEAGVVIHAIDNSQAMIERCQQLPIPKNTLAEILWQQDDIQNIHMMNASFTVLNFTMQFIVKEDRQSLLDQIFQSLNPGGVLVLSEKIAFEDSDEEQRQNQLYYQFKRLNGYSDLEIAQKRTALEKVLLPDTLDLHHQRLKAAGFTDVMVWFQCFNFVSMIAIK